MPQNISYILTGFIIVLTILLGGFLALTDFKTDTLMGTPRTITIFIMFGYAAFRTFRLIMTIKKERHENSAD